MVDLLYLQLQKYKQAEIFFWYSKARTDIFVSKYNWPIVEDAFHCPQTFTGNTSHSSLTSRPSNFCLWGLIRQLGSIIFN